MLDTPKQTAMEKSVAFFLILLKVFPVYIQVIVVTDLGEISANTFLGMVCSFNADTISSLGFFIKV